MTIFAGIAEFERTLIISRTSNGRVPAKARGVIFGRPNKMRLDQQELARELVKDGKSIGITCDSSSEILALAQIRCRSSGSPGHVGSRTRLCGRCALEDKSRFLRGFD
jgi:hypothetical protein